MELIIGFTYLCCQKWSHSYSSRSEISQNRYENEELKVLKPISVHILNLMLSEKKPIWYNVGVKLQINWKDCYRHPFREMLNLTANYVVIWNWNVSNGTVRRLGVEWKSALTKATIYYQIFDFIPSTQWFLFLLQYFLKKNEMTCDEIFTKISSLWSMNTLRSTVDVLDQ